MSDYIGALTFFIPASSCYS